MATATDTDATQIVVAAIDALNEADPQRLRELLSRDVEMHPLRVAGRRVCRGRDAVIDMLLATPAAARPRIAVGHLAVQGDGVVVALGSISTGGQAMPFAGLHVLRRGRIAMMRHYHSDLELLRHLGLLAHDGPPAPRTGD